MDRADRIVRIVTRMPLDERRDIALRIIAGIEREVGTIDAVVRFGMLVPLAEKVIGAEYSPLPMSRRREDVMIRMFVAAQMADEGYTHSQIGRAMLRDHSSVTCMLHNMRELKAGFYGTPALKQYKEFKMLTL